ncbi:Hypothetical predicted protein [Drosophila guanche]|uniref:Uncharacterized protein n=1 Tax=Drosophila guanche TaxID=7266 RepID=A0A3B0JFN4_DROGU|nr:Hypothetical predicted protein [Drosophila guanche]
MPGMPPAHGCPCQAKHVIYEPLFNVNLDGGQRQRLVRVWRRLIGVATRIEQKKITITHTSVKAGKAMLDTGIPICNKT